MMGRPPISRSGFGHRSVRGRSRVPSPAPKDKSCLESSSSFSTHGASLRSFFFPNSGIDLHQACHDKSRDRRGHDPEEIVLIAQLLLEPAAEHGRHHHTQSHDPRGDGVVDRFVLSLRHHDHEHRVGRKAKAVTELLHGNGKVDQIKILRQGLGDIDKDEIRADAWRRP